MFLLGVRDTPAEPFRYLRMPADEQGSMDGFLRLRTALNDPAQREKAVRRYVAQAVDGERKELAEQLALSAQRALALFAGGRGEDGQWRGGFQAISEFMEANVPETERERAGEVLVRILNGVLFELAQVSRQQAGQAPLEPGDFTQGFMTQAVFALSDVQHYPAPMAFELKDFEQVQASVFQVARAPGKNVVYLGCVLLIIGIFAMLYIRDRRIWVWLAPTSSVAPESAQASTGAGPVHATMALSTNRKTLDGDREFVQLSRAQPPGAST